MEPEAKETPLQVWYRLRQSLARQLQEQMGRDFDTLEDQLLRANAAGDSLPTLAESLHVTRPAAKGESGRHGKPSN